MALEFGTDQRVRADEVVIDGTIVTTFRASRGTGRDPANTEADLLTLNSGGLTGTYTPGAAGAGLVPPPASEGREAACQEHAEQEGADHLDPELVHPSSVLGHIDASGERAEGLLQEAILAAAYREAGGSARQAAMATRRLEP